VAESGRAGDITLYTGNDDHIVVDFLTRFQFGDVEIRYRGLQIKSKQRNNITCATAPAWQ
jgi:hypothetical protein